MSESAFNVLVLCESSTSYGRLCAQGISRYARNHSNWLIRHMPHDQMTVLDPNVPMRWDWNGVIARIADERLLKLVRKLDLPTVDIMGDVALDRVVTVINDHDRMVEMALEHLLASGMRRLAFCGVKGLPFSDQRQAAFERYACPAGVTQDVYQSPLRKRGPLRNENQRWLTDLKAMKRWVDQLPKPVGIMACNDTRARHVIEVCMALGLSVPSDVCVIGVDNDDVLCELGTPSLSSVDPNADAIGFRAAAALHKMMLGEPIPEEQVVIAPLGVETRDSTNTVAFEDRLLNEAIVYVQKHSHQGMTVSHIVQHLGTSRSTLERRFREHLGCTLHEYIQKLRLEHVKRLLLETSYPAARIAEMTGFGTSSYFGAMFRKEMGMTPGEFRQQHANVA